ncbi:hypothetical protein GHV55_10690 [Pseudomonas aeruginosa]|nr:hypothetical protein [Pseudomonas aeruginosa]
MPVFEVVSGGDRRSLMKRFERKSKQQAISELVDFHLLNCDRIEKLEAERDAALARVAKLEHSQSFQRDIDYSVLSEYADKHRLHFNNLCAVVRSALIALPAQAQHSGPDHLELTEDLKDILGRPNFTCIHLAHALRQMGFVIDHKSAAEQAACLHWMLNHYLAHGANWRAHAEAELKAAAPGKEVGHE